MSQNQRPLGFWGGLCASTMDRTEPTRCCRAVEPTRLTCRHRSLLVSFIKEDIGMFTPPSRAALPIFTDNDSKAYTGATIAVPATLAQLQHALTQFVAHYPSPWLWRSNRDRWRSRRRAILWRNNDPCSVKFPSCFGPHWGR